MYALELGDEEGRDGAGIGGCEAGDAEVDGRGRSGVCDVEGWKGGCEDGLAEVDVFAGSF